MTTASTTTTATSTSTSSTRRIRTRAFGVLGAVLAPLVVWIIAVPLLGADLLVNIGGGSPQAVGAGAVVATSLLAGLFGWALLAALEHFTSRAHAVWKGVAIVVLLLSLGGPLTIATMPSTTAVLALMHLTVAAVLLPTLLRSGPVGVHRSGQGYGGSA